MNPFYQLLNQINDRLDLPQPEKSRIILEIAADLEDCYDLYRAQGLDDKEALRRTEEKFRLNDENLNALIEIHQPVFQQWMNQLSTQARTLWERLLLILILGIILAFAGPVLFSTKMIKDAMGFVFPIAMFETMGILIFLYKLYQLYLKKSHRTQMLRTGLESLLFLGGAGLITGITAICHFSWHFTDQTLKDIPQFSMYLTQCLLKGSAVMTTALLASTSLAIFWYIVIQRIQRIELYEAEILLQTK